jgi:hypothetical protein
MISRLGAVIMGVWGMGRIWIIVCLILPMVRLLVEMIGVRLGAVGGEGWERGIFTR